MRAGISDNLHGDGHLTSIGARFKTRKCPDLLGETAAKLPHARRLNFLFSARRHEEGSRAAGGSRADQVVTRCLGDWSSACESGARV